MSPRALFAALVLFPLAVGCGGARGADPPAAAPEPTVSIGWLRDRPYQTPWGTGPDRIPSTRKPHWFCFTDINHSTSSLCGHTEADCQSASAQYTAPSRGGAQTVRIECEPHAKAACNTALGVCYPTIAICEANRKVVARDVGPSALSGAPRDVGQDRTKAVPGAPSGRDQAKARSAKQVAADDPTGSCAWQE